MPVWHKQPIPVPAPLVATVTHDRAEITLPEGPAARFAMVRVPTLVLRTATEIATRRRDAEDEPLLVIYERASSDARDVLQAAGISYVGDDGRVYVRAPGILVEHSAPGRSPIGSWRSAADDDAVRNPFAKRSSRVARWLLLHPQEAFALRELADVVDLNPAAVSRVVRALEEAALVEDSKPPSDGRRKRVRLRSARALLDAWLPLWQNRRLAQRRWDVGARDPDAAVALVDEALAARPGSWALGGLSGAAAVKRIVEPAEAVVWTTEEGLSTLEELLMPVPARGGRAVLRVAAAPDAWTLGLARDIHGRPVADLVQLWLDCASGGERALEAADAVAEAAGWT